jgi:hypothetical protein
VQTLAVFGHIIGENKMSENGEQRWWTDGIL